MTKKECKAQTQKHINNVRLFMLQCIQEIASKADIHDSSKLSSPELETFVKYTPKLANSVYGSKQYYKFLTAMKPALDHHYSVSRHHPEHFRKGLKGMNLLDLVEMLCDWKAASKRHKTGNFRKSIIQNQKRFKYSNELKQIFLNTIDVLEEKK